MQRIKFTILRALFCFFFISRNICYVHRVKEMRMKAAKVQNTFKSSLKGGNVNVKKTEDVCKNAKVRIFADDHAKCIGKPINKIQNLKKQVLFDPKKVSDEKTHLEVHHHIYEEYLHLIDTYKAWYYSYASSCCKGTGEGKICKPRKADELPSTHCAEYKHHFLDVHQMLLKLKSEEKFADDYLNKKIDKSDGEEEEEKKKMALSMVTRNLFDYSSESIGKEKKFKEIAKRINEIGLPELNGLELKDYLKKLENEY